MFRYTTNAGLVATELEAQADAFRRITDANVVVSEAAIQMVHDLEDCIHRLNHVLAGGIDVKG